MKVFIRRSTNNRSIIRTPTRSFPVCEFTSCIFVGPISKGTSPHFSKLDIMRWCLYLWNMVETHFWENGDNPFNNFMDSCQFWTFLVTFYTPTTSTYFRNDVPSISAPSELRTSVKMSYGAEHTSLSGGLWGFDFSIEIRIHVEMQRFLWQNFSNFCEENSKYS